MRSVLTESVNALILAVVGTGLWFHACRAEAAPRAPRRAAAEVESGSWLHLEAKGWGVDEKQSRDGVARKVRAQIDDYLQEQAPGLEWLPSRKFVREHLVKGPPRRLEGEDTTIDGTPMKCWEWTVEVNAQDWRAILHQDREIRAERRMILLGKILAGLVALLAVIAAYIRLDDGTRGYYTGRLRLAAGAVLALVGAGLWWVS